TYATALMKIANDIRWMGSGPRAGLGELQLPAVQPGSSIMPGKVNPVIAESVLQVCAQVQGNDQVVALGNQWGNFELNTMMPVVAHNLLQAIAILASASRDFAEHAIARLAATRSGPSLVAARVMRATPLGAQCQQLTLPLVGRWWTLSPALLVLWAPLGFRATCYYYRKAYYRAFFWAPPACAVRDLPKAYAGETRFPFLFQNVHRYFFYLAVIVVLFLWWDALLAFRFPQGVGVGVGTLVMLANILLLSSYTFSCHSCRHVCGGHVDAFSRAGLRHRLWEAVSRLNERHGAVAWASMISVALTDLYIRLVAMGVLHDIRILDRKSTRLNSSHEWISYAVFC